MLAHWYLARFPLCRIGSVQRDQLAIYTVRSIMVYRHVLFEKYADHYCYCTLHICSYGGDRYLPPTSEFFGAFGLLKATAADVILVQRSCCSCSISIIFLQSFIVGSTPCSSVLYLALLLSLLVTCLRGDAARPCNCILVLVSQLVRPTKRQPYGYDHLLFVLRPHRRTRGFRR